MSQNVPVSNANFQTVKQILRSRINILAQVAAAVSSAPTEVSAKTTVIGPKV